MKPQLKRPQDPAQRDALGQILAQAFAFPPTEADAWFHAAGADNLRVFEVNGQVLGGLLVIPMGQVFGGQVLPMAGLAGVAVRADLRRKGMASEMLRQVLAELAADGFALSTLFASNHALYRKVGYEQAGARFVGELDPRTLRLDERSLKVTPLTEADHGAVMALQQRLAVNTPGSLARGSYCWARLLGPHRGLPAHGLLLEDEHGSLEGALLWRQQNTAGSQQIFQVTEALASTARANRQLWTLVADLSTTSQRVRVPTAPNDPLYAALPHPTMSMELHETWMTRVLDLKRALERRGYPRHLQAWLELDIEDPQLPQNGGRFILELSEGRGKVRAGGSGQIRLHVRGLAALFTGHCSAQNLALRDLVRGPTDALEELSAAFAGPAPWMRDAF